MIVTLWASRQGLPMAHLHRALAQLTPAAERGGPIDAFCSIIRCRATRPHTITLVVLRVR